MQSSAPAAGTGSIKNLTPIDENQCSVPLIIGSYATRRMTREAIIFRLFVILFSLAGLSNGVVAGTLEAYEREAQQVLQKLRGAMMQEMQKAMQIGPKAAIGVCRHLAPEIEERIEQETGWEVKRTGSRVRNPANAPEPHERSILMGFEVRADAGQGPEMLKTVRLLDRGGTQMVHMMQAVPTFNECLVCHGKNIPPEVMQEIKALYPSDKAIGYEVGDIRGAFSLYKKFDPAKQPEGNANTEWDRIAALQLPAIQPLDDNGKSGNTITGSDLFKRHCVSCHSPSDIADHLFDSDRDAGSGSACEKLETHGATNPEHDCDIVAFLKALRIASDAK